jgi:hypothetical protein
VKVACALIVTASPSNFERLIQVHSKGFRKGRDTSSPRGSRSASWRLAYGPHHLTKSRRNQTPRPGKISKSSMPGRASSVARYAQ